MRTDISEDPKGDPTKDATRADGPPPGRPPGVEPLLPPEDRDAAPSAQPGGDAEAGVTYADRVEGGPEHAPDDDPRPRPDRAPPRPR